MFLGVVFLKLQLTPRVAYIVENFGLLLKPLLTE